MPDYEKIVENFFKKKEDAIIQNEDIRSESKSLGLALNAEGFIYRYVEQKKYFVVNTQDSEVIEFSRCEYLNDRLQPGRLWFDDKCNGESKSLEFIKWANSIFRWTRRSFTYVEGFDFIGSQALALFQDGQLELGPPPRENTVW